MIDIKDIENKTPNLEQWLLDIAKELGAEKAEMFDGSIKSLNSEDESTGA